MENKNRRREKASSITNIGKRLLLIFAAFISQTLEAIFAFSGVKEKNLHFFCILLTYYLNKGFRLDFHNFLEVHG